MLEAKSLRRVGIVLIVAALTIQVFEIGKYWWQADPRVICARLHYWRDWLDCVHGKSHLYVSVTETAFATWLFAALSWFLGKILPHWISVILPIFAIVALGWVIIGQWYEVVMPYAHFGRPELDDVLAFALSESRLIPFFVAPPLGTWLCAVAARKRRRTRQLASSHLREIF
jgi:hypothetical protein